MLVQRTLIALATAAIASAQSGYGPPPAYCPPSCTATTKLTFTNTVTTTTTTTGPPTACPYRLTVTPSSSACRSNVTITTTAPPTACPYFFTETTTITAVHNFTATLTQNITSTLTQNVTVTATSTPTPSSCSFLEVFTFASANCTDTGAQAVGFTTGVGRSVLTLAADDINNNSSSSSSSECTKFPDPVGSMIFGVIGEPFPDDCYLTVYDTDMCVSDVPSRVNVGGQGDQCWAFASPRSMRMTCG
ncbi:hypothetical protein LTR36_010728 [Oleoguttula mirabilis]|uniref:Uncharacterized protein n=1 Tax=Oleoguttula mirabilis TaxID=1507867 RepID=A0AAV9JR77_9PEZI|nr:hypothetical protein LTR36_010728 [Oleoguttula mirabilis]